ncbi:hypothetical protein DMB66_31895 [Actinoplanes sp. ATCC 53533]|nr:hypothetical protein DMB66_31895 [Actinoplanes sp. ATCC 53533]
MARPGVGRRLPARPVRRRRGDPGADRRTLTNGRVNIKARQRMITQYAVASAADGLVVGTAPRQFPTY